MFTIGKKVLSVLLLVLIAAAPLGCLSINKPPEKQDRTEVKVGGDKGVVVDHPGGDTDKDKR
jgi:hypothetical protein